MPIDLDALEYLKQNATRGPLEVQRWKEDTFIGSRFTAVCLWDENGNLLNPVDAAFIVDWCNAFEEVAAELRAARERLALTELAQTAMEAWRDKQIARERWLDHMRDRKDALDEVYVNRTEDLKQEMYLAAKTAENAFQEWRAEMKEAGDA
jgi:hypothetical protein